MWVELFVSVNQGMGVWEGVSHPRIKEVVLIVYFKREREEREFRQNCMYMMIFRIECTNFFLIFSHFRHFF